jgi:quercetin dioxygenase-like cupin family protein
MPTKSAAYLPGRLAGLQWQAAAGVRDVAHSRRSSAYNWADRGLLIKGGNLMAVSLAKPHEIVDVRPFGAALTHIKTAPLVKTAGLEVIRLVVPRGREIPTHKAPGEILLLCLEGSVALTAQGRTDELAAGQLLILPAAAPHSLKGIEDSLLLLTKRLPERESLDLAYEARVDEASEESFPASDPPARSPLTRS